MADETTANETYDTGEYALADEATDEVDETTEDDESVDWDEPRARKAMQKKNREAKAPRERLKAFGDVTPEELSALRKAKADEEEAKKTSEDKYAELVSAKASTEKELWRTKVAWEKGLTPAQAKRLVGTTLDELTADADALVEDLGLSKADNEVALSTRGKELRGGSNPEVEAALDYDKIATDIRGRR